MNYFTRISCLILLLLTLLFLAFQAPTRSNTRPAKDSVKEKAERISGDKFTHFALTPKGTRVYAVTKPNAAMLNAIDNGLTKLFSIAARNYKSKLSHRFYTIYIAKPDREKTNSGKYLPVISVKAAQYAGSKYDKGGYIYAAGIVLSFRNPAFMIADHRKQFDLVSQIVRYETEHIVLFHNDRNRFRATADHSKGGGHPILKN